MRTKAGSRCFIMMLSNISCRDALKSEGLFRSALMGTKRSFDGAVELGPAVLECQFPESREISREFSKFLTIVVTSIRSLSRFVLQSQRVAHDFPALHRNREFVRSNREFINTEFSNSAWRIWQ